MYNYDEKQMSEANRRCNNIQSCQVVDIDKGRGLIYALPWGNGETSWIKPKDFEIAVYEPGEWIDMVLDTVSSQGHISLRSARFVGRTPQKFIPKD
ncbi:MAG: hypothetical protein HFG22_13970 [Lachnospiraceae bacterium]|nr:hypothetical protein [Lachnospiraceae bacterium]